MNEEELLLLLRRLGFLVCVTLGPVPTAQGPVPCAQRFFRTTVRMREAAPKLQITNHMSRTVKSTSSEIHTFTLLSRPPSIEERMPIQNRSLDYRVPP